MNETFGQSVFANSAFITWPTAEIVDNNLLDLKIFNSFSPHCNNSWSLFVISKNVWKKRLVERFLLILHSLHGPQQELLIRIYFTCTFSIHFPHIHRIDFLYLLCHKNVWMRRLVETLMQNQHSLHVRFIFRTNLPYYMYFKYK